MEFSFSALWNRCVKPRPGQSVVPLGHYFRSPPVNLDKCNFSGSKAVNESGFQGKCHLLYTCVILKLIVGITIDKILFQTCSGDGSQFFSFVII